MYDLQYRLHYINFVAWLALIFPGLTIVCGAQQKISPVPDNPVQATAADIVNLHVSVTDSRGNHVQGLSKEDFTVSVDGKPQEIAFFRDGDEPSSVCILFDSSDSMAGGMRATEQRKLLKVVNLLPSRFAAMSHPSNEYFLITFNEHPSVLLDGVGRDDLISKLSRPPSAPIKGETALYDALRLGLEKLAGATHRKRVIILISDGEGENASQTKGKELKELAGVRGIPIYYINVSSSTVVNPGERGVPMGELVKLTGGAYFYPETFDSFRSDTVKMLEDFTSLMARNIRYQYTLGFTPGAPDSKWHKIKVKLTSLPGDPNGLKRVVVRSREKYYAVANPQ